MKQPLRVAVVGSDDRIDRLLADLSPAVLPRRFADWNALQCDAFLPELVALLPGHPIPPHDAGAPIHPLCVNDLASACHLEAKFLQGHRATPQSRLLGCSAVMARFRGNLLTTGRTALPLLLTGENGTGKDLAAVVAHQLSSRAGKPFVAVNCGAVPSGLAETEFFGSLRGAFTGAENREGFCQQANGGTLFLDEVGEMPPEIQAKMLRVLESQEVRRVGSSKVERADFRLICATNRDLGAEMRAGRFREDLFYRINVLALKLPPLRERLEDLPELSEHFLASAPQRSQPPRLSDEALDRMAGYRWPGNLRQLRNVLLRAAVLHELPLLEAGHLEWEPEA